MLAMSIAKCTFKTMIKIGSIYALLWPVQIPSMDIQAEETTKPVSVKDRNGRVSIEDYISLFKSV